MQSEVHVRDWGLHENWLDRKQHGRIATSHLEVERIRMIDDWSRKLWSDNPMMHKIVAAVFGVLSACAGLVALVASDVA